MRVSAVLGVLATAALLVASALAGGGGTIAAAPAVAIGQQQFGNTNNGIYEGYAADFWNLPLIAADKVTIDWESSKSPSGGNAAYAVYLWPVGTTDFSINNASPLQSFSIGDNLKAESAFTAGETGAYPLMFKGNCCSSTPRYGGAYDFVVYVKHKLVTHLTQPTTALLVRGRSAMPRSGAIAVQVFTADGKPVVDRGVGGTLTGYWMKAWHPLGKALARGGTVSVHYKLPASAQGPLRLQLNLGGGSYQGVKLSYRGLKAA